MRERASWEGVVRTGNGLGDACVYVRVEKRKYVCVRGMKERETMGREGSVTFPTICSCWCVRVCVLHNIQILKNAVNSTGWTGYQVLSRPPTANRSLTPPPPSLHLARREIGRMSQDVRVWVVGRVFLVVGVGLRAGLSGCMSVSIAMCISAN